MAKEAPTLTVGVDDASPALKQLENDITNLSWGTPRGTLDVTGVDSAAQETLLLLAGYTITLNGVFNDATDKSHLTLRTVPSSSVTRTVTLVMSGQTLTAETVFTDYALTRGADGSLLWSAPAVHNNTAVPTWS
jgi:hypothetical protein